MKQGNSSAAFVQYFEAERLAAGAWLKKELSLIFLRDLYRNGKGCVPMRQIQRCGRFWMHGLTSTEAFQSFRNL